MQSVLPSSKKDVLVQLSFFAACYLAYQMVRGYVQGTEQAAFWNATQIISWESSMHLFVEPAVQSWSQGQDWLIGSANWIYLNSHYLISFSVLVWIYLKRHAYFAGIRNAFIAAMVMALIGYLVVPTAPPRMMPEWGFTDTIAQATGVHAESSSAGGMVNFYAAIPSMHVCFALLLGGWSSFLVKPKIVKWLWLAYPLLIIWVVIATGNHYLVDVLLGALTALISAVLVAGLSKSTCK